MTLERHDHAVTHTTHVLKHTRVQRGVKDNPLMFFLDFSKTISHLHVHFRVAARISLRHILTQLW